MVPAVSGLFRQRLAALHMLTPQQQLILTWKDPEGLLVAATSEDAVCVCWMCVRAWCW